MCTWRLWHPCWHLAVESPYRLRTACVLVRVSSLCGLAYFGVPGSNNQEMYASGTNLIMNEESLKKLILNGLYENKLSVANIYYTVNASWKRLKGLLKPCTYENKLSVANIIILCMLHGSV